MPTLNFKGKALVQNYHLTVPYHELKPVKSKSLTKTASLHDNLVVHGDNLKALKALLPYYHGKVKCIYIDPPYNTGNEGWVYNDNVSSPMLQEWLGKVVDREDLTRHDKWLCMMMPRLKLLREFLTEDGVILVSIDDHEAARLRTLMDEIFGEENFIAQLVWEKGRKNDAKLFSAGHEYLIVFARSLQRLRDNKTVWRETRPGAQELWDKYEALKKVHGDKYDEIEHGLQEWFKALPESHPSKGLSRFKHVDRAGPWRDRDISWPGGGGPRYDVRHPRTKLPCKVPDRGWIYATAEKMNEMIKLGLVEFREDHTKPPFSKAHLRPLAEELNEDADTSMEDEEDQSADLGLQVMSSVIYKQSQVTIKQFRQLMGDVKFPNPKDPEILERLIAYVTNGDKTAVVLDAFGGSGTTAQSVLSLNYTDAGNRRFILIESQPDYIEKLTAERVRRVIKGGSKVKEEALRKGYGGTFSFFELGHPMRLESLLEGNKLPSYENLAAYVFFTATGEEFDPSRVNQKAWFIGESAKYEVYLIYAPDLDFLKREALTLERARALPKGRGKRRLVFAPTKYMDSIHLEENNIDFCQLPFEIYKTAKSAIQIEKTENAKTAKK
jgi:adenine-specific DNA-methyltransferase